MTGAASDLRPGLSQQMVEIMNTSDSLRDTDDS